MVMSNIVTIVLGDWSNDGHGRRTDINIKTNLTKKEMIEAYHKACDKLGFYFHEVCDDYEEDFVTQDIVEIMEKYGYEFNFEEEADEYYHNRIGEEEYIHMMLWFLKQGNPDFEYEVVTPTYFNGWWGDLNESFGYGLYR